MSNVTAIEVETAKCWSRGGRRLVEQTDRAIVIRACEINVPDQAAVCYILLNALTDRCGIAPFSVAKEEIEHVLDSLSSIAEFPSIENK